MTDDRELFQDKTHIHIIPTSEVIIGERARIDPGDVRQLAESIETIGLLNPITVEVVDGVPHLRAGFRRLTAVMLLSTEQRSARGLRPGEIYARYLHELTEVERLLVELEENRARKDFNKAEEALMIAKLKAAIEAERGKSISSKFLSSLIGFSVGQISMGLQVADAVKNEGRKELLEANSIKGAYTRLQSAKKLEELLDRAKKIELAESTARNFEENLHCGDALKWIRTVPDESIDFVHFDPPWGIGIDSYDRNYHYGTFEDDSDTGIRISRELIPQLFRVLRTDTYMVTWFGIQHYQRIYEELEGAGFGVYPVPFIWYKTDKAGAQNDPTRSVINAYEPFILATKGTPRFYRPLPSNVLSFPMPRGAERVHFAQKSEEMLSVVIQAFSHGSMSVLDPTFGSGSALVAATALGRKIYGAEKDKDNYHNAVTWLRRAQVK